MKVQIGLKGSNEIREYQTSGVVHKPREGKFELRLTGGDVKWDVTVFTDALWYFATSVENNGEEGFEDAD